MQRIPLTDGSGGWFDLDAAEQYDEDTYWDGNNHISKATGSQWNHEKLYRTKSKRWVLCSSSQWQGSGESWEEISDDAAAKWLVQNGHEHKDAEEAIASLEI